MTRVRSRSMIKPIHKQAGLGSLSILVILLVLSFIVADMSQRLLVTHRDVNTRLILEPLTAIKTLQLSPAHLAKLRDKYAQFTPQDKDNSGDGTESVLSQAQQALQGGELQKVFVGSKSLTLRAILQDTQRGNRSFALVEVSDMTSNTTSVEKVIDSHNIEGFKLSIISGTAVTLNRTLTEEIQNITLSMYRSDNISNPGIK
jgi:hypothetical protein